MGPDLHLCASHDDTSHPWIYIYIYKHISQHNLLFTSVLCMSWPPHSISPGLPLLQLWHWAPQPTPASSLPHRLRLALRSRCPGGVHSWSLSSHILATWNMVWGGFAIWASWLLPSDVLSCPPFHIDRGFCHSRHWHISTPIFSPNQTDLSCTGWLACWRGTMLNTSLGLHLMFPECNGITGWLFCRDPCTTLGRSTGKYGGPSRNHSPCSLQLSSMHVDWTLLPLALTGQHHSSHWNSLTAGRCPHGHLHFISIAQFEDIVGQINLALGCLQEVDPNDKSILNISFHYITTVLLTSKPKTKSFHHAPTHPGICLGIPQLYSLHWCLITQLHTQTAIYDGDLCSSFYHCHHLSPANRYGHLHWQCLIRHPVELSHWWLIITWWCHTHWCCSLWIVNMDWPNLWRWFTLPGLATCLLLLLRTLRLHVTNFPTSEALHLLTAFSGHVSISSTLVTLDSGWTSPTSISPPLPTLFHQICHQSLQPHLFIWGTVGISISVLLTHESDATSGHTPLTEHFPVHCWSPDFLQSILQCRWVLLCSSICNIVVPTPSQENFLGYILLQLLTNPGIGFWDFRQDNVCKVLKWLPLMLLQTVELSSRWSWMFSLAKSQFQCIP